MASIFRVVLLFQLYPLLLLPLLLLLQTVSALPHKIHGLSQYHKQTFSLRHRNPSFSQSALSGDFKTHYYNQTLDHFNFAPYSYVTFQQRYVINSKYWDSGPNSTSPIFAFLGAEGSLDYDLEDIVFLSDTAPSFKSLCVYIEHRFYGKSNPLGSMEESMENDTTRGYLNSAQALVDYAEILLHIKEKLSSHDSPIIVVGGSYGGMLASWFRLKYPHIALGALASSAPILYFDNITPQNGYHSVVTKDFKDVSESCYQTIQKSWAEIDKAASKPDGLSILSQRFNTCSLLNNSGELKDFLETMYNVAAQYDGRPINRVLMVCKGIDGGKEKSDILDRIFAGVVSYSGKKTCYDTNQYNDPSSETNMGWDWQRCSEMVMRIGRGENDTMFQASPFNLTKFINECTEFYGVSPRPHWITTYYGGHDIKLVLKRFASNIIFSNGLRDPYSSGGVLEDLSQSIVAVTTLNGSHCQDITTSNTIAPKWLFMQRNKEVEIIKEWLKTYYSDLQALKK